MLTSPLALESLTARIPEAMGRDNGGIETAQLAYSISKAAAATNKELRRLANLLGKGKSLDAFARLNHANGAISAYNALSAPELDQWKTCCQTLHWAEPKELNEGLLKCLTDAFGTFDSLKTQLYSEYRKRRQIGSAASSYPLIAVLAQNCPDETEFASELEQTEAKVIAEIEAEMISCMGNPDADEEMIKILETHREHLFEPSDVQGQFIKDALEIEQNSNLAASEEKLHELSKNEPLLAPDQDWKRFETDYFSCLDFIEEKGLQKSISKKSLKILDTYRDQIAALRNPFEINIQIQDTLTRIKADRKLRNAKNETFQRLVQLIETAKAEGYTLDGDAEEELAKLKIRGASRAIKKTSAAKAKANIQEPVRSETQSKRNLALFGTIAAAIAIGAYFVFPFSSEDSPSTAKNSAKESMPATAATQEVEAPAVNPSIIENKVEQETPAVVEAQTSNNPNEVSLEVAVTEKPEPITLSQNAERFIEKVGQFESLLSEGLRLQDDPLISDLIAAIDAITTAEEEPPSFEEAQLRFHELKDQYAKQRDTLTAKLRERHSLQLAELESLIDTASASTRTIESPVSASKIYELAKNTENSSKQISRLHPTFEDQQAAKLMLKFEASQRERNRIQELKTSLTKTKTANDYVRLFNKLVSSDQYSKEEKHLGQLISKVPFEFASALKERLSPNDEATWLAFIKNPTFINETISLDSQESAILKRLVDHSTFSTVQAVQVSSYQGGDKPISVRTMFVCEQITEAKSKSSDGTLYKSSLRGYDAEGFIKKRIQDFDCIIRKNDSSWGFRVSDAELSRESNYYLESLNPRLKAIIASPTRGSLIELIEELNQRRELSPTFRAFWKAEALKTMSLNPLKWGLALSPSLLAQAQELKSLENDQRRWRAYSDQQDPNSEFAKHFQVHRASESNLFKEIDRFSNLVKLAAQGEIVPAGYADAKGDVHFAPKIKTNLPLLSINALSGQLKRLDQDVAPIGLTPIFAFRFENAAHEPEFQQMAANSSFDISQSPSADLLKPLLELK